MNNPSPKDPSPKTVLEGFTFLENMLAESEPFVPYRAEHFGVWSPRFTTIIMEAASQAESLWRATLIHRAPASQRAQLAKKRMTVDNYRREFKQEFVPQWAVYFGGADPEVIRPFEHWNGSGGEQWW